MLIQSRCLQNKCLNCIVCNNLLDIVSIIFDSDRRNIDIICDRGPVVYAVDYGPPLFAARIG
jgi:hypothetical protein